VDECARRGHNAPLFDVYADSNLRGGTVGTPWALHTVLWGTRKGPPKEAIAGDGLSACGFKDSNRMMGDGKI
jgi:hypothetical protein